MDKEAIFTKHVEWRTKETRDKTINDFSPSDPRIKHLYEVLASDMEVEKLLSVETDHCPQSSGCMIVSLKHGRMLYTGDTAPCANIRLYASGVKLLITEATLGSGLESQAKQKKHQTTDQALRLIEQAKPERTILTHFSPRYDRVPEILAKHSELKTLVAFDFMKVSWT